MTRPTIREWARIQSEIGSTAWKWCGQIKSTTFLPSNLKVGEPRFRYCEYLEFGQSLQKIWYSWLDQLSANANPKHLHMRSVATKLSFNWPSNWSNWTCWCHKVESLVATGLFQADHNKHTNIDLCASAVAFSRSDVIFFFVFCTGKWAYLPSQYKGRNVFTDKAVMFLQESLSFQYSSTLLCLTQSQKKKKIAHF